MHGGQCIFVVWRTMHVRTLSVLYTSIDRYRPEAGRHRQHHRTAARAIQLFVYTALHVERDGRKANTLYVFAEMCIIIAARFVYQLLYSTIRHYRWKRDFGDGRRVKSSDGESIFQCTALNRAPRAVSSIPANI